MAYPSAGVAAEQPSPWQELHDNSREASSPFSPVMVLRPKLSTIPHAESLLVVVALERRYLGAATQ
jgi:hypothetical protein